jgi:hypothetical protein
MVTYSRIYLIPVRRIDEDDDCSVLETGVHKNDKKVSLFVHV